MRKELSRNERLKEASAVPARHASGWPDREVATGAIAEDDQQLVKFHGMYLQERSKRP